MIRPYEYLFETCDIAILETHFRWTCLYNGSGLRVKKVTSTETTVFVYDASSKLIAEYSTEISQTPQVSYLTTDHLGSPRVITNENGAVTSRKDFTAFGEESATAERTPAIGYSGAAEIRQGYTGYEKDDESGLDFAQARYYSSTHGRFTSVDPLTASGSIRNPQTFNRYSYVLNSPYKFVDPLGLLSVATSACAGSCANNEQNLDVRRAGGHDSSAADYFENQQIQQQPQTPPSQQGAFQVNGAALRFGEFIVSGTVSENNVTFNVGADSAAPPGLEGLMGGKTQFSVELSLTSESAVDVVPTDVKTYSIDKDRPHDMTTTYNQNSSRMTPIGKDEGTNNIADIPPPSLKDPSETRSSPPPGQVDFKNTKFVGRKLSTTATFNAQFSTGAVDSPRHSNSVLVKIVGRNSNNKFVTERIKVTINFNVPSTR